MTAHPRLPPARTPGRYRVAMVCLGNICRSPVAAAVLRDRVAAAGLDDVDVVSGGTGDWHVGDPMDPRAAATLTGAGYAAEHRARQIDAHWLTECDVLLAMDTANRRDIAALGPVDPGRLLMLRDFDPLAPGADVPDPYYGGPDGFADVLAMVERSCDALAAALAAR